MQPKTAPHWGLPLERLYRQLFNPQLHLMAYGHIYSNHGAMTPGVTGETADGMSLEKIGTIIDALRGERYRWSWPVRLTRTPPLKLAACWLTAAFVLVL